MACWQQIYTSRPQGLMHMAQRKTESLVRLEYRVGLKTNLCILSQDLLPRWTLIGFE